MTLRWQRARRLDSVMHTSPGQLGFLFSLGGLWVRFFIVLFVLILFSILQTSRSAVLTPITKKPPCAESTPIKLTHLREDRPGLLRDVFNGGVCLYPKVLTIGADEATHLSKH